MEKVFNTLGFVKDGGFQIYDKQNMNTFIKAHTGKKIFLELKVFNDVSGCVTAYFYGVLIPRAKEGFNALGNRYDNLTTEHELKLQSPITRISDFNPEKQRWEVSTKRISELSSSEMSQFIEDVFRFCAVELGVVLPNPSQFK